MKRRIKLIFLHFMSLTVSVAPLAACVAINGDKYVRTPSDTVKLTLGGVICLAFAILKILDKLPMPRRVTVFSAVLLLSYLMQPLLNDLVLLSGAALIGEISDALIFRPLIKRVREEIRVDKCSAATAERVEETIRKYVGRM